METVALAPPMRRLPRAWRIDLPGGAWAIVAVYAAMLIGVALAVPFPNWIDELGHFSMIRAHVDAPTLFPDWSSYRMLDVADLSRWSDDPNYINHPALYYLLLAPLFALSADPLLFRLVNAAMAAGALVLMLVTVRRRCGDAVSPVWFGFAAAAFPKAVVVGGAINNDNLAMLAASFLFAGVMGMPGAGWWLLAGLAMAGWTKLTAFVALSAVAGCWLALRMVRGEVRWSDPLIGCAGAGVIIGAVPYLVTLARTGSLVWVHAATWYVPPGERAALDFPGFVAYFLRTVAHKWSAAEGAFPVWVVAAVLALMAGTAVLGARARVARLPVLAYGFGTAMLFAIHLIFGWRSFEALGDLTIAQARYYNILWPGVALGIAAGLTAAELRWRPAPWIVAVPMAMMTLAGAVLIVSL
ncbi:MULTISPECIES: hypothetical protein [unclassified Sphingobium]|uniref:hypothetical protein n=1 Tax=unclassified Sphingobium TaxID=2611147 RepID=UPI0035A5A50C